MAKASKLGGALVARKGHAVPSTRSSQARPPKPKSVAETIAVTVRLDPKRYRLLKVYGAEHRETNQAIIVSALDQFLPSSRARKK